MHEHPGRVDHAAQARPARVDASWASAARRDRRIAPGTDLGARQLERSPTPRRARAAGHRRQARVREQTVDGRQVAETEPRAECRQRRDRSARRSGRQSSRSNAVSCRLRAARRPRARARASIGSGRTPAAMFVTHEIARQRIPMMPRRKHLGHRGHARRDRAPSARSIRISAGVSNAGPSQAA